MKQQTNKFELLRDKEIISILDGDKQFGTLEIDGKDSGIKIEMPYLSGPTLCEISKRCGLPASYLRNGSAQSRWVYFDELMDYCIQNNRISDLLSFLFSKEQFMNTLKGRSPAHIEYAHTQIVKTVIEHINSILYFGGNELVLIGKKFLIREIGTNISVEVPAVERMRHGIRLYQIAQDLRISESCFNQKLRNELSEENWSNVNKVDRKKKRS